MWLTREARPAVVLIGSPNHPAGCTLSDEQIRAIHEATDPDQILAVDETYFGFTGAADNRGELVQEMDRLLVIRSLSKYFGLADPLLRFDFLAERLTCHALDHLELFQAAAREMVSQRESFWAFLRGFPCFVPMARRRTSCR